ncbi:MAG: PAS domain-containing protein [Bacteroidetes bacterium]|nr:PAS domain-containing protein [Bacteroidota bacterium]
MKITFKIVLIAIIGLLSTIICVVIAYINLYKFQDVFQHLGNAQIKNYKTASNISTNLQKITAQNALYFINKDNATEVKKLTDTILLLTIEINNDVDFLEHQINNTYMQYAEIERIRDFAAKLILSRQARFKLIELVNDQKWDEYAEYRVGEYKTLVDASLESIKIYMDYLSEISLDFCFDESKEIVSSSIQMLQVTTIIVIILLSVLSFVIIKGISKSLRQTIKAGKEITKGNFNVDLSMSKSKDETGELTRTFINMLNKIKQTMETEKNLKEDIMLKSQWYEYLLDSIPIPVSASDVNKNLTFLNKAGLSLLGRTDRAEVLGQRCRKIWNTEICDTEACAVNSIPLGSSKKYFQHSSKMYTVEAQYIKDINGIVVGNVEVFEDVTDELNYIEKLASGFNLYEILLDSYAEGIIIVGDAQTIIYANSSAFAKLNTSSSEIVGKKFNDIRKLAEKYRKNSLFDDIFFIKIDDFVAIKERIFEDMDTSIKEIINKQKVFDM